MSTPNPPTEDQQSTQSPEQADSGGKTTPPAPPKATGSVPTLYRHCKYPEWGRAVIVREQSSKRSYMFEDGQVRLFKKGYYHLLEEVQLDEADALDLATVLGGALERRSGPAEAPSAADKPRASRIGRIRLEERIAFLDSEYSGGLSGEAWDREIRGRGTTTRRKRHRDPVLADAHRLLVERPPDPDDPQGLLDALVNVLEPSDLLGARRREKLAALGPSESAELGQALHGLLFGEVPHPIRLERWIDALSRPPHKLSNWALATIPSALVEPKEHLFVRRTVFGRQATLSGLHLPNKPSAPAYHKALEVARDLARRLAAEGEETRDLLDVYDFVRITLRPKAKETILAGR